MLTLCLIIEFNLIYHYSITICIDFTICLCTLRVYVLVALLCILHFELLWTFNGNHFLFLFSESTLSTDTTIMHLVKIIRLAPITSSWMWTWYATILRKVLWPKLLLFVLFFRVRIALCLFDNSHVYVQHNKNKYCYG